MTEQQAWLEIAIAYWTAVGEMTELQSDITMYMGENHDGICDAICGLYYNDVISVDQWDAMGNTVDSNGYFWPCTESNRLLRGDYCYLQYLRCGGRKVKF